MLKSLAGRLVRSIKDTHGFQKRFLPSPLSGNPRFKFSNGSSKSQTGEHKRPTGSSIFLSRAAIQEQVRSIVKGLDQFYENREKTSPDEQKKIEDEQLQQLLNQRILRREFLNDGAGLTLKTLSFLYATSR